MAMTYAPHAPSPADPLRPVALAAAGGCERAAGQLVRATYAPLMRAAAKILRDESAAEDVVSSSFTRALSALRQGKFRYDAPVAAWLSKIVAMGALDALRARRRAPLSPLPDQPSAELSDPAPSPEESLDARRAMQALSLALSSLPERQRQALMLTELDGLSVPEAAQVMGCSPGAVELLLVRARRSLRERVGR